MTRSKKKSFTGWLIMGVVVILGAVFSDKILEYTAKVPVLKDAVDALKNKA